MSDNNSTAKGDPKGGNATEKTFTQEEVDRIVQERVKRVKHEPPADYNELKAKVAEYEKNAGKSEGETEELKERIGKLEDENRAMRHEAEVSTWKAAASEKTGVPASILRGGTAEEIEAHAESVKAVMKKGGYPSVDPGNSPAKAEMSKEEVLAIEDPRKRRAAIAANIDKGSSPRVRGTHNRRF